MMQIDPCGHRVLIKQDILAERSDVHRRAKSAGIVLADTTDARREQLSMDTGVVLKIGQTAFKEFGGDPWCKVGDRVAFAKHTGKIFRDPNNQNNIYLVQNDEDIIAVIGDSNE